MKVTVKHIKSEINENNYKIIDKFIYFLQEQYPLKNDVVVNFVGERVGKMTTGSRRKDSQIFVLTKKRIIRDVLRTLAHEWVHEYQMNVLNRDRGPDIGGENEDMANAEAGSLMKKFEKINQKYKEKMYE